MYRYLCQCTGIIKRGNRTGLRCNNRAKYREENNVYCGIHCSRRIFLDWCSDAEKAQKLNDELIIEEVESKRNERKSEKGSLHVSISDVNNSIYRRKGHIFVITDEELLILKDSELFFFYVPLKRRKYHVFYDFSNILENDISFEEIKNLRKQGYSIHMVIFNDE